jgi:hypothetical protein
MRIALDDECRRPFVALWPKMNTRSAKVTSFDKQFVRDYLDA